MRVVVTGGAGFIGSSVTEHLHRAGCAVTVIDDLSSGRRSNLDELVDDGVRLVTASVLDREVVEAACDGAQAVVHLAAQVSVPASIADPAHNHAVNLDGTLVVLEAARRNEAQMIFASSAAVYGPSDAPLQHEGLLPHPISPYAASKLAAEQHLLTWQECYGLPALAFRFFNIYGPRQLPSDAYAAVIPAFVSRALASQTLRINGDGLQTRDFVSVATVAGLITRAVLDRVTHPAPVNLAFGTRTNLLELVAELETTVGTELAVEHAPVRAGDIRASCGDSTRLRALFPGVTPQPLRDGLAATVDWYRRHVSPAERVG